MLLSADVGFGEIGMDQLSVIRGYKTPNMTKLAGDGLHTEEVTIAEVLRDAGYYTSHVGKWHLGDIEQAYASNQGFM